MKSNFKLTCLEVIIVLISLCLVPAISAQAADYDWTSITQTAILNPDNQTTSHQFGFPVVISGDTALVADLDTDTGDEDVVYVFTRSGTIWTQQAKLTPSDPETNMGFGAAIALNGDTALIGAAFDRVEDQYKPGRVYVFTGSGSSWTQRAELTPLDSSNDDYFGASVALDGETALIGAYGKDNQTGAAYIFTGSGDTWTQRAKLTADDGETNDSFGQAVDLEGTTAAVSAYERDNQTGAAYIFTGSSDSWSQQAILTAGDAAEDESFGISVSYSNDTICIGQGLLNPSGQHVYVFTRSGAIWSQQAKLTGSHSTPLDLFGLALDYQDDVAVIGAPFYDNLTGSAYVFTRDGSTWSEQKWWQASDAVELGAFGVSVARNGNTILIGSPWLESGMGRVYVYNVEEKSTPLPQPRGVGGEVSGVNRAGVVLPFLVLILVIAVSGILWWNRRRQA
jgi:hypothetical protein